MMRTRAGIVSVIASLALPSPAAAETTDHDRALELVETGKAHVEAGEFGRARDAFAEAYALQSAAETACELGAAEVEVGEHLSAAGHLDVCLAQAAAGSSSRARGESAFPKAKSHIGSVTVITHQSVEHDPSPPKPLDGCVVFIDGAQQAPVARGAPIYVSPGTHQLRVDQFGFKGAGTMIALKAGEETTVNLTLESPAPPRRRSPPSFAPAILAFAVGGVGAGVGIGFLVYNDDQNEAAEELGRGRRCKSSSDPACADIAEAQSDANDSGNIAVGAFSAAGVAAGTGAILLYWAIVRSKPAMRDMASLPIVLPMVNEKGLFGGGVEGVVVGGRF